MGDVDGDGHVDLVLQSGGEVRIYPGHGDGTFAEHLTLTAAASPVMLEVSDFNGDGSPDVATFDYSGTVTVFSGEALTSQTGPLPSVVIDSLVTNAHISGTVTVSGWAINNTTAVGPAISGVQINVDGTVVGTATYGISRLDVCTAYPGRTGCPNVGFTYLLNSAVLSGGTHTITAVATDTASNLSSFSVNVTTPAPVLPSVLIDSLAANAPSRAHNSSGWAINNITTIGVAISNVQIKVDGVLVGSAAYGIPRLDVCTVYAGRLGCPMLVSPTN